jgi:hypothetical protein
VIALQFSLQDSFGDGWSGATATITDCDGNVLYDPLTLISGSILIKCVDPSNGIRVVVSNGDYPEEISWSLSFGSTTLTGGAGQSSEMCFDTETSAATLVLTDSGADGWNGAHITVMTCGYSILYSGTLVSE